MNISPLSWIPPLHETFDAFELSRQQAEERPLKFRTAFSEYIRKPPKEHAVPTREGLATLWISGSAQMKEAEMRALRKIIPSHIPIYFVDLRREKHFYWAEEPVKSVYLKEKGEKRYWSYRSDVNKAKKEISLQAVDALPFIKEKVVAERCGLIPVRIKAKEKEINNSKDIEQFITFFDQLKGERWIHFHCAAGWNRTTTYMIAIDLLSNPHIPKEAIFLRHHCLGGDDYLVKSSMKPNRLFLDRLFLFVQERDKGSKKTWSQFLDKVYV